MPESTKAVVLSPPRDPVPPAYPPRTDTAAVSAFWGCDSEFFPHALAAIASAMEHATPQCAYDLFIVQSSIPHNRMDAAVAWMTRYPNATLRFININPLLDTMRNTMPTTREYSVAVFYRIFAPLLFPSHDRIVYLDSDVAVLGDVAELFRADLGGKTLGAVRDFSAISQSRTNPAVAEFWQTRLGKKPGGDYFNSGVLVMDLERLRRNNTLEQFLARAGALAGTKLPDQDLINAVLDGDIQPLPAAWNCFDWLADETEASPNFHYVDADFLPEIREARRGVKVLHFAEKKPWTPLYRGTFAETYWRYAAQTPFFAQTLDRVRRDAAPAKMLLRRAVTRLQELHFLLRLALAPEAKKEKYRARIRNLRWMRTALTRQRKGIGELLKRDSS